MSMNGCLWGLSQPDLLNELDHADAVSLVEDDRTAKTIELSREPQRSKTFGVTIKPSSSGIAKCFPRALGRVQRVKSNAVEKNWYVGFTMFIMSRTLKLHRK